VDMQPDTQPAVAFAGAEKPRPFLARLPGAFVYPFRGLGWAMILIAGSLLWLLPAATVVIPLPYLDKAVAAVFWAYLSAYVFKVIGSCAKGEDAPPDWPDVMDLVGEILRPLLWVVAAAVVSFGPVGVYLGRHSWELNFGDGLFWALLAWGVLYFPMGLLAVALHGSVGALNPFLVLRGIVKVGTGYLAVVVGFFAALASSFLLRRFMSGVPVVGQFASGAVTVYFLMAAMRILGLLYQAHAKRLGWFS